MTNTDLEMFMAKLKMLVYDPASTGNNQFIEAKRPEIGFLYEELSYLYAIGIRFKDTTIGEEQLHGLEDVGNLTRRLFKAVQEAEDIVDMFMSSAIIKNDVIVGFDDDALLILDRLTGDRKKLDIISIVGMGGLGKTTLATKILNDSLVEYYFDVRGWVNVSHAYSKRDMLIKLLASIGKSFHAETSEWKPMQLIAAL